MRTLAGRIAGILFVSALLVPAAAAASDDGGNGTGQSVRRRGAVIRGGHDKASAWLVAEYRDLQLHKRTSRAANTTAIELRVGDDVVAVTVGRNGVSVARGNRRIAIDSAETFASVQSLLGDSPAVFAARGMLSELEPISALKAPDMSLLSAAAFVASLVGDSGAPQRIADRFVEKHRGIYRQVQEEKNGGCWSAYTQETTAAWDELQGCMEDANDKGALRAAYERLACNAVWLLRAESAWFEYLNCISPLNAINQ
jgi:hypothetical protein